MNREFFESLSRIYDDYVARNECAGARVLIRTIDGVCYTLRLIIERSDGSVTFLHYEKSSARKVDGKVAWPAAIIPYWRITAVELVAATDEAERPIGFMPTNDSEG